MRELWLDDAWNDYVSWQKEDKKTINRINKLIKDIGRTGIGASNIQWSI